MKTAATACGACELEVISATGTCPRCGAPVPMPDEAPPVGDGPTLEVLSAILSGLGDSSDLTREQLARAAWMLLLLDGTTAREGTGAELLVLAESHFSGQGLPDPEGRVLLSVVDDDQWEDDRWEDAAHLWALCWACPLAEVGQLVDVIDGRAFLFLGRGGRWTWHAGAPDPNTIAAMAEARAACGRTGTTLAAQTRACTLPAGHVGRHECHGDHLWGVDGWGSDEARDYRRELDLEDARLAMEEEE